MAEYCSNESSQLTPEMTGSCSNESTVVEAHRENLESFLITYDPMRLPVKLVSHRVITRNMKENFDSLDRNHLESDIITRYLLQLVCQRIREDVKVYGRLVSALSRLGGGVRGECEAMRRELELMKRNMGNDEVGASKEKIITEKDVPYLTEELADVSFKWEEIGIALQLPTIVLDDCRESNSNIIKLNDILRVWASGTYSRPTTVGGLRVALASRTVGLPKVAQKLHNWEIDYSTVNRQAITSSTPEITYQSYDTEVFEGKSTLLEVQVSCNACECYQWSKDGQFLLDGSDFCGVCCNVVYINKASQSTEGKYSCTVRSGSETVCSDEINLKVLYPPEKEVLKVPYSVMEGGMENSGNADIPSVLKGIDHIQRYFKLKEKILKKELLLQDVLPGEHLCRIAEKLIGWDLKPYLLQLEEADVHNIKFGINKESPELQRQEALRKWKNKVTDPTYGNLLAACVEGEWESADVIVELL